MFYHKFLFRRFNKDLSIFYNDKIIHLRSRRRCFLNRVNDFIRSDSVVILAVLRTLESWSSRGLAHRTEQWSCRSVSSRMIPYPFHRGLRKEIPEELFEPQVRNDLAPVTKRGKKIKHKLINNYVYQRKLSLRFILNTKWMCFATLQGLR